VRFFAAGRASAAQNDTLFEQLPVLKEQTIGDIFEDITKDFLEKASHL